MTRYQEGEKYKKKMKTGGKSESKQRSRVRGGMSQTRIVG